MHGENSRGPRTGPQGFPHVINCKTAGCFPVKRVVTPPVPHMMMVDEIHIQLCGFFFFLKHDHDCSLMLPLQSCLDSIRLIMLMIQGVRRENAVVIVSFVCS